MLLSKLIRPAARVTHAVDFCRHLSTPVANIIEPIINTDIPIIQKRIKHKVPQKRFVNMSYSLTFFRSVCTKFNLLRQY